MQHCCVCAHSSSASHFPSRKSNLSLTLPNRMRFTRCCTPSTPTFPGAPSSPTTSVSPPRTASFATTLLLLLLLPHNNKTHTSLNSALAMFPTKPQTHLAPLTPPSTLSSSPLSTTSANSSSTNASTTHYSHYPQHPFLFHLLSRSLSLSTTLPSFPLSNLFSVTSPLSGGSS